MKLIKNTIYIINGETALLDAWVSIIDGIIGIIS
jgi:hypothetical protein